jgi:hypothetical protein
VSLFVKLWTDILGDPKLLRAARKGAKCLDQIPWLIVFAKAAQDDGRLSVNGEAAEPEDIAALVPCTTPKKIAGCMAECVNLGILAEDDDGVLRFASWERRASGKPSDAPSAIAERVRKHRERKRAERTGNAERETGGNALPGVTDNATEKEKELEQEQESKGASGDAPTVEDRAVLEFNAVWALYPKRPNNSKKAAFRAWQARRRAGVAAEDLEAGVMRYAAYCVARGIVGSELVKQASTFFGPNEHWTEPWDVTPAPAASSNGATADTPAYHRARVLLTLAREYDLLTYNGNRAEYGARVERACADPRAGPTIRDDLQRVRFSRGLGEPRSEHFALLEIARRLEAAPTPLQRHAS